MATIVKEINLDAPAENVWAALRDFQAVHIRVAPGFLTASRPDGENARLVTFANGTTAREVLVTADDATRRLVYSIPPNARLAHYSAAAQVFAESGTRSRFVWTVDLLPDSIAAYVSGQMEEGLKAMKPTFEKA